jgi:hypothetical protein
MELWNPDGGEILKAEARSDGSRIPLVLAPYESRVFVLEDRLEAKTAGLRNTEPSNTSQEEIVDLSAGWQVHFADRATSMALDKLTSWTELPGRQYYSGEAVYSRIVSVIQVPAMDARTFIDFGTGTPFEDKRRPGANGMLALLDPSIREAAIVFVNGKQAGALWHPPYRIDVSKFIHGGENRIEVHVYNTAINLLAGQPPRDYTALRAKYGRRFDPQDMDNLQPVRSGMLGPVRLVEQRGK